MSYQGRGKSLNTNQSIVCEHYRTDKMEKLQMNKKTKNQAAALRREKQAAFRQ
jgi:hypothetical protein